MKKAEPLRELFNGLDQRLIEPIEETADVSADTVERIEAMTLSRIRPRSRPLAKATWRILLVAAIIAMLCIGVGVGVVAGRWQMPTKHTSPIVELDSLSDTMTPIYARVSENDLQVTVDSYSIDSLSNTLRLRLTVSSCNGQPLSERTAERVSTETAFENVRIYYNNTPIGNISPGISKSTTLYRYDSGEDLTTAVYQLTCPASTTLGEGQYRVELTDLKDTVCLWEDVGFAYDSIQEVCAVYSESVDSRNLPTDPYESTYSLTPDTIKIPLLYGNDRVVIDNALQIDDEDPAYQLVYLSLSGEIDSLPKLIPIDTQTGTEYWGEYRQKEADHVTMWLRFPRNCASSIVLKAPGTARPEYAFVNTDGEVVDSFEQITRFAGTWALTWEIPSVDNAWRTVPLQKDLTLGDKTLHIEKVEIDERSLYISGSYEPIVGWDSTSNEPTESVVLADEQGAAVILSDGSKLEEPFRHGGNGKLETNGSFRFGGSLRAEIDPDSVYGLILWDQTIVLTTP